MPFNRPSLPTIIQRVQQDIASQLQGTDPTLRRKLLYIIGKAVAGAIHGNYGNLNWISQQIPPDTADAGIMLQWAAMFGIKPKQPNPASGTAPITGVNGTIVNTGSVVQDGNGNQYTSTASVTIAGGTAAMPVTANTPGSAGNLAIGAQLTFVTPLAGVNSLAALTAAFTGGSDLETNASVLNRLLQALQNAG